MSALFIIVILITVSSIGIMVVRFINTRLFIKKMREGKVDIMVETRMGNKVILNSESLSPAHIRETVEMILHN